MYFLVKPRLSHGVFLHILDISLMNDLGFRQLPFQRINRQVAFPDWNLLIHKIIGYHDVRPQRTIINCNVRSDTSSEACLHSGKMLQVDVILTLELAS